MKDRKLTKSNSNCLVKSKLIFFILIFTCVTITTCSNHSTRASLTNQHDLISIPIPPKIPNNIAYVREKYPNFSRTKSCLMKNVFYEAPRYTPNMERSEKYVEHAKQQLGLPDDAPKEALYSTSKKLLLKNIEQERIKVINVTMNRVKSKYYDSKVCKVVYQYKQFSWTLEPHKVSAKLETRFKNNKIEMDNIKVIEDMVDHALLNGYDDLTNGAMFYHTTWSSPYWKSSKQFVVATLWHIYYMQPESN